MNFKEAYEDDLEQVFFDEEEFASKHVIDGRECTIVLEKTGHEGARKYFSRSRSTFNPKETAVNKVQYIIYIREKDIERKLTVNATIILDGTKYFIQNVICQAGMYTLTVGTYAV